MPVLDYFGCGRVDCIFGMDEKTQPTAGKCVCLSETNRAYRVSKGVVELRASQAQTAEFLSEWVQSMGAVSVLFPGMPVDMRRPRLMALLIVSAVQEELGDLRALVLEQATRVLEFENEIESEKRGEGYDGNGGRYWDAPRCCGCKAPATHSDGAGEPLCWLCYDALDNASPEELVETEAEAPVVAEP